MNALLLFNLALGLVASVPDVTGMTYRPGNGNQNWIEVQKEERT